MKKAAFIIGAADLVLLVVCIIVYAGRDRSVPVISFAENDIVYTVGMDTSLLLEGVTAADNRDGDVTDSILIEKITDTDGENVIVTYVARDASNNVGKASRTFRAVKMPDAAPESIAQPEGTGTEGAGTDGSGENGSGENGSGETAAAEESGPENTAEGNQEDDPDSENSGDNPEDANRDEEKQDEAGNNANADQEDQNAEEQGAEQEENREPAGPEPVLTMNSDVITTKMGHAPNWGTVISEMSDDKDDYNTLYNNLKLEGTVDLNNTGDYPVRLYTIDSDGNRSVIRDLVVRVEA